METHGMEAIKKDLEKIKEDLSIIKTTTIRLETREERYETDIENLKRDVKEISEKKIPQIHQDIVTLKTKASVWGGVVAVIVSIVTGILIKFSELFLR